MADDITIKDRELERIVEHRLISALNLGLDPEDAEACAGSFVDLHDLERLINRGCDPAVAFAILA